MSNGSAPKPEDRRPGVGIWRAGPKRGARHHPDKPFGVLHIEGKKKWALAKCGVELRLK
jgi:hypothetical protein